MNKEERLYLAELLKSCGLVPLGKIERNMAFSFYLQPTDDFVPVFVPNIQSIRTVKVLTGVIGAAKKSEGANPRKSEFRLVLGDHVANIRDLPVLYELKFIHSIDRQYVEAIRRVMSELPTNAEQVQACLTNDVSVGGTKISDMILQEN